MHYFYLWVHRFVSDDDQIIARTCFGITSDIDRRIHGYEGHVGHSVQFKNIWIGPERPIRELETKIKADFSDYLFCGHQNFRYEWITEEISYEQIYNWVMWEIGDEFNPIKLHA
jgi:hypothetical protein